MVMAVDAFHRHLPKVLERLERDSGLADYAQLVDVPAAERLPQALARAQARYEATPEGERVYPIIDAIRELARFSANFTSLAMQLFQIDLFERLPSLEPLMPLSPALASVGKMIEASKLTLAGSSTQARARYEQILERLAQPDRGGFDDTYYNGITHAIHYLLGLLKASIGSSDAERHAQLLDRDREHRVNAWRVRVSMHMSQGDVEEARKCQRRAELLQLQEGAAQRYLGMSVGFELFANGIIGDLLGVKRSLSAVRALAASYPGWKVLEQVGECYYRWLQGDLRGAFDALTPTLALQPGRHPYYCIVAAVHVGLLTELGRVPEAIVEGDRCLAICEQLRIDAHLRSLQRALALACAAGGQHARAAAILDAAIEYCRPLGMAGLAIGGLYEARALVAVQVSDQTAFERAAEACATEYKRARNPALAARCARLMQEARQGHVSLPPESGEGSALSLAGGSSDEGFETVESRMLECVDRYDRGRCALALLLEHTESLAGHFYGIEQDGRVTLLATLPEEPEDPGLTSWLAEYVCAEAASSQSGATASATASASSDDDEDTDSGEVLDTRYRDEQGRYFEATLLATSSRESRLVAVLALQVGRGPRTVAPKELLSELARTLHQAGDAPGIPG